MKFYLDEDLAPAIAVALRKRGVDAVSAHEVGNVELGDKEQLAFATRQGRCMVSANARDFRSLGHEAVEQGRPHAGIVLCPPRIASTRPVTAIGDSSCQVPALKRRTWSLCSATASMAPPGEKSASRNPGALVSWTASTRSGARRTLTVPPRTSAIHVDANRPLAVVHTRSAAHAEMAAAALHDAMTVGSRPAPEPGPPIVRRLETSR